MKRVLLAVALAVFGLTATLGVSSTAIAQAPAGPAITGDWVIQVTGEKLLVGTLHLTRVGDTVIGTSSVQGGVLQINGTLKGNVCSAKWRGPKGGTGWMTITFTPSFTSFQGDWGYGGRKPSGQFVSKQLTQTAF
jgi:hypothetical protein